MLRRVGRLSPLALLLLALVMWEGTAAAVTTKDVSIVNFAFNPATVKIGLGSSAKWTNNAATTSHTSSSDGFNDGLGTTGVNLWHSGNMVGGGTTFTFTFQAAGSFPYHCSVHPSMHGTVNVPLKLPKNGTVGTRFKVTWALADPGMDFQFNIQRADPGGSFQNWMTAVSHTVLFAKFNPTQTGNYKFRAQLERISTGADSGFSPARTITVS
jgi:plastocyanin